MKNIFLSLLASLLLTPLVLAQSGLDKAVVVAGQFLLDSEANLRSGLERLSSGAEPPP